MPGTIAITEFSWTLTALVGLCLCLWAAIDAQADLNYLHASGLNGAREVIARGNLRDELIRVVIQLIFMVVGFYAMDSPPANPDTPVTPVGIVITGGLIAASVLLVAKAICNRTDRQRVIRLLATTPQDERIASQTRHGLALVLALVAVVIGGVVSVLWR